MKNSLLIVMLLLGTVGATLAPPASPNHQVAARMARTNAWRRATPSISSRVRYASPGYEYRFNRAEARTAAGYNRLFSF
jgi:hypothetical protein